VPLSASDHAIALELKERLAGLGELVEFRVFGPRLRGDEARDLDVWAVFVTVDGTLRALVDTACITVGFENGITLCPLLSSQNEASSPDAPPIVERIRAEGVLI